MRSTVGKRREEYGIIDDWYMIREEMKYLHPSKKLKYMQRMGAKFFDNLFKKKKKTSFLTIEWV